MKKEDTRKIVGVLLIVVGIVILLKGFGYLNLSLRKPLVAVPNGYAGMEITTDVKSFSFPLATVAPGATYKWSVTLKNTGTVDWTYPEFFLRIARDYTQKTFSSGVPGYNTAYVDKCDSKVDDISCREDLIGTWKFQFSYDGQNWQDASSFIQDRVFKLGFYEGLKAGEAKTFWFKITAPTNIQGNYYVIVTGLAQIGSTLYIVDSKVDTISVGTVIGELVLNFIGALSLIAGLGFALWGFKVW
jgi:hypothetical protein